MDVIATAHIVADGGWHIADTLGTALLGLGIVAGLLLFASGRADRRSGPGGPVPRDRTGHLESADDGDSHDACYAVNRPGKVSIRFSVRTRAREAPRPGCARSP